MPWVLKMLSITDNILLSLVNMMKETCKCTIESQGTLSLIPVRNNVANETVCANFLQSVLKNVQVKTTIKGP
jgi:hypothetical protein